MKKVLTLAFALALVVCLLAFGSTAASAATEGDYSYTITDGEAIITEYFGDDSDLAIPATLGGYPVTAIGGWAFENCDFLSTVIIPDSVTTIEDYAFRWCDALISVAIPESVITIGDGAFRYCKSLASVNIPKSVRYIGDSAFNNCSSLGKIGVAIDNPSYSTLDGVLFNKNRSVLIQCPGGKSGSYVIPTSVITVGSASFFECAHLTSVAIGINVADINISAFRYCESLCDVYYSGSEGDRADIYIDDYNEWLTDATWHYNCNFAAITTQSKNVSVANGETAKVTVGATGDGLKYTWYIKNAGGSKFSKSSITSATYSVAMSDKADGRQVYCVITDQYGNSVTTDTVTLSMKTELKITKQPVDVCVKNGETVTVKVTAVGDGLTYKWYFKDAGASSYKLTTTFKGNTYTTTMTDARAGRRVLCKVYDKYGNMVQTKSVLLSQAVRITKQPVDVCVANGKTATVKVVAKGDGLTYKWYFKDAGASSYKLTTSFTGNTYSITMTDARAGRRVLCKVYDKYGNMVKSSSALLSQAVRITKQPVSVTVAKGATAKVIVTAKGDGLTYKWYFKDAGASEYKYTSSFKGNTYSVTMTDARAGRRVLCMVYDKYGNKVQSNTVTLRMK